MERLGARVEKELGRFGPAAGMAAIVAAWPAAVGAEVARNAWPARLTRERVLLVSTGSSAWAFELSQLAPVVLEQLAHALGDAAPTGLRFAPGPLPEPAAEAPAGDAREPLVPSPEAMARAEQLTSQIDDSELRERVARAAALSLEEARSDRRF